MNSPKRLGVSPAATSTPTGVFSQRLRGFEALFPHAGTLGCVVCLPPQLFLPVYLHVNVGLPSLSATILAHPSPPATAFSRDLFTPPTSLDECFFFNSLIVRLPYSSIVCQFWLFFAVKFVVLLLAM